MTSAYADLPVGSCEPGTSVSATIKGVFTANATRYAVWVLGDIYVDNVYKISIQQCVAGTISPPGGTLAIASLTWPCGSALEIRNLVVSWEASTASCADTPGCASRKAKCSAPNLGTIVVSTPLVVDFASNAPQCLGTPIAFSSDVSGGKTPYSYSWTFGDGVGTSTLASPSYTYAAPGTYTVTLTVAGSDGSVDSHSYGVTVYAPPVTSETHIDVACFGGASGSIDLMVSSGTAPYSYLWSNGATTQDVSGLVAGTYSVTVTDANGCTATRPVTIAQPAATLSLTATHVDVACYGDTTGSIDLTVAGGTAPYTYLWSNGAPAQDLTGLAAGTYSVTATDASGCTATRSVTITQPAALSASVTHLDVGCYGDSTASIDLSVTGGTLPYAYLWSNGATTQDLSGIPAGSYSVTVTDAKGCTVTQSAIVTQPSMPLLATGTYVDVTCFGSATGSIDLTVSGGTPPYAYLWSNGATTQDLSSLVAESYSVTVTDAHGCSATWSVNIDQPAAPLTIAATHVDVVCYGAATGAIDVTVSGGTPSYSVLWSNGATTQDLSGLASGTYSVTVSDSRGCTATKSVQITQPPSALALSDTHTNVDCYGAATGSIDLTAAGGMPPYGYLWSNGATSQDLSGLTAGTYSVTTVDAHGCSAVHFVSIGQPSAALVLETFVADVACHGGATGVVNLSVSGGTGPYSYAWSTGQTTEDLSGVQAGTYLVTVTDTYGCTASTSAAVAEPASPLVASADPVAPLVVGDPLTLAGGPNGMASYSWSGPSGFSSSLQNPIVSGSATLAMAGVYVLTVMDAGGCVAQASTEVTISAPPPCAMTLSHTHVDVTCYGAATGSIDLSVTGGTPPYTFSWSNGAATEDLAGLAAGTYIVTVTDSATCSAQLAASISQPLTPLEAHAGEVTSVACFGAATGSFLVWASGGTGPYAYSIDGTDFSSSGFFSGLAAGSYSVTARDAAGCVGVATVSVSEPAAALFLDIVGVTDALCAGAANGTAAVIVGGGTAPYVYSRDGGATTQSSGTFGGLTAGVYTIVAIDASGCAASQIISIGQPEPLALSESHTDVGCWDGGTGSINLTVDGGAAPYAFSWSNGATTEDLAGLPADSYAVLVTDANGCTAAGAVEIGQPLAPLAISTSHVDAACFGGATGAIDTSATGGTPPYEYSWSNGAVTEDVTDLAAGAYSVDVTDANGCAVSAMVTIAAPSQPLTAIITYGATVDLGAPFQLVGGPSGMASYSWSGPNGFASSEQNPVVSASATAAMAGTYTLTVTNSAGCQSGALVSVDFGQGAGGECTRGVIISEIAWAGTAADPQAEWIELQNLLDRDVDLQGWQLRWRGAAPQTSGDIVWKTLPLSGWIGGAEVHPPLGLRSDISDRADQWLDLRDQIRRRDFFLIERLNDDTVTDIAADLIYDAFPLEERRLSLSDEGEIVQLIDPSGCVVDTANRELEGIGGWLAGDEESGATMERTDPTREDVAANWHTNLGIITYGVDRDGTALFGTAGTVNQPLLETGIEERETISLRLTATGIAAPLPVLGTVNSGIPTRTAALLEGDDDPVPGTFSVDVQTSYVVVTPTSALPPGEYDLWVRVGEVALVIHAQTP
jgi:PKD repeat protein